MVAQGLDKELCGKAHMREVRRMPIRLEFVMVVEDIDAIVTKAATTQKFFLPSTFC